MAMLAFATIASSIGLTTFSTGLRISFIGSMTASTSLKTSSLVPETRSARASAHPSEMDGRHAELIHEEARQLRDGDDEQHAFQSGRSESLFLGSGGQ